MSNDSEGSTSVFKKLLFSRRVVFGGDLSESLFKPLGNDLLEALLQVEKQLFNLPARSLETYFSSGHL